MTDNIFKGELVRLEIADPARDSGPFTAWCRDSEYMRLMGSEPPRFFAAQFEKDWIEKFLVEEGFLFSILSNTDDRVIGNVDISDMNPATREGWLGIGIGDRAYWGNGYGTEAMRIILRYCFEELNLHRISLNVFEYNERALRCYLGLGFKVEGRERQFLFREGRRWDLIYMGLLKPEWEAMKE